MTSTTSLQPISTAPRDQFILVACPSGYTTTPTVFTTAIRHSDYKVGRWVDHANDDLADGGLVPTHWMPLPTETPRAQGRVWIRPDDLQRVRFAPHLCRVEPDQRDGFVPLYTSAQPPAAAPRQPLPDQLLRAMHHIDEFGLFCEYDEFEQIARAIERACAKAWGVTLTGAPE